RIRLRAWLRHVTRGQARARAPDGAQRRAPQRRDRERQRAPPRGAQGAPRKALPGDRPRQRVDPEARPRRELRARARGAGSCEPRPRDRLPRGAALVDLGAEAMSDRRAPAAPWRRDLVVVVLAALAVRLVWNLVVHKPLDYAFADMAGYLE